MLSCIWIRSAVFATVSVALNLSTASAQDVAPGYRYNTLVSFGTKAAEGVLASPGVTIGGDGCLYGTTIRGGSDKDVLGVGTLYKYDPATKTLSTLVRFGTGEISGSLPFYGVTLVQDHLLYGTTSEGGTSGNGTLYSYDLTTGKYATLLEFGSDAVPGTHPSSGVTLGSDGCLYGTTFSGGKGGSPENGIPHGGGTLYRYDPATGICTTLVHFATVSTPGYYPKGGVLQGGDGHLYGTTQTGGKGLPQLATIKKAGTLGASRIPSIPPQVRDTGRGTLYRYNLATNKFETLVRFGTATVAAHTPFSSLTLGADGSLYGTTQYGGKGGILYRYNPQSRTFSSLLDFGTVVPNGAIPFSGVILGKNGKLYGTLYNGGTGMGGNRVHGKGTKGGGVLYQYDPASRHYQTLVNFGTATAPGFYPDAGVAQGKDGTLYGTTAVGSAIDPFGDGGGKGTLFSLLLPAP